MLAACQIQCPESFTSAVLQGWLRIALEEGILTEVRDISLHKRRESRYKKGLNFQKVEEILEFLKMVIT